MIRALLAGLLLLLPCGALAAQSAPLRDDLRLQTVRAEGLERVLRAAERDRLPLDPLLLKALEGVTKGASPARVVDVVAGMAGRMRLVRGELGAEATDETLVTGAAALQAGARPVQLRELARPGSPGETAAAFDALAYLLERGIPTIDSLEMLRALAEGGGRATDYLALQRLTEQDVRGGATPAEAAWRHTRELARRVPAGVR